MVSSGQMCKKQAMKNWTSTRKTREHHRDDNEKLKDDKEEFKYIRCWIRRLQLAHFLF